MNIEENWTAIVQILNSIPREGMNNFLQWLETTDFKTAPASTKYHLNVKGGLTQHSLNVLKFARILNKETGANLDDGSIVVAALLHDLCKVHYYVEGEEWDKEYKEKTNQWRKKAVWKVEDKLPLGHGEKSVILATRYIELSSAEMLAIRWHMAFSDAGVHFGYPSGSPFRESLNSCPLLKIIAMADQMAEMCETINIE